MLVSSRIWKKRFQLARFCLSATINGKTLRSEAMNACYALESRETRYAKAFKIESLQRDTRAAEQDYLLYRKKHEEARISAAMDKDKN